MRGGKIKIENGLANITHFEVRRARELIDVGTKLLIFKIRMTPFWWRGDMYNICGEDGNYPYCTIMAEFGFHFNATFTVM